ncbi:MAG: zinc dependent phospholipase C family protein [Chitinophagaceae bacterium]|nr:zinc dependent phospholipase C family protein [Chitinophagaceae bacterium]
MKKVSILVLLLSVSVKSFCWGFYAHKLVNYYAVFLLPPEMMTLYKKNISFLNDHAVDPDKRRYAIIREAPRHFIDMDRYGPPPYSALPRKWSDAVARFSEDSLNAHGIVPLWIQVMLQRLTKAFKDADQAKILKLSAELGHYIADSHVPLHACSNHNGQFTHQQGIHGFWESRVPELLAEKEWDFLIGRAAYIRDPLDFTWKRVLESASEADSVLFLERKLSEGFPPERKYAYETRSGVMAKQYSSEYSIAYNAMLDDMVERRLRQSIFAVASFWYTAWVNAGRPDLRRLMNQDFSEQELKEFVELDSKWKNEQPKGEICE